MKNVSSPSHWILAFLLGSAFLALIILTGALWRSLLVAGLFAYLLNPVVQYLENRWRLKRPWATNIVYTSFFVLLLSIIYVSGLLLLNQLPQWSAELNEAYMALRKWLERPLPLLGFTIQPEIIYDYLERSATNALGDFSFSADSLLSGLTDNLLWSLVILVSLYYFLRDGTKIKPTLIQLLPPAYHTEVDDVWTGLNQIWGVFLRVQLLIFAVLAVLFVTSNLLIIWLYRQGWLPLSPIGLIILLLIVYTAIQQVDNLWLRPQYMGQALQLHSGVVIITLIAAFIYLGVLGALLSIPFLASGKFLAIYFYQRWITHYYPPPNAEPTLTDSEA